MEKRRCQRLRITIPAMIKTIDQEAGLSISSTIDLSGLGLCVATKQELVRGQEITLHFCIEHQNVNLKAKVMWVEKNNIAPEKESLVGVKILDTAVHDESKFVKFFAKQLLEISKSKKS